MKTNNATMAAKVAECQRVARSRRNDLLAAVLLAPAKAVLWVASVALEALCCLNPLALAVCLLSDE